MNSFPHVPPGFRFHPTDEELVDYYLRRKVTARRIDLDVIKDVDLYKIEPWDLQELCRIGTEEQNEWYFFSHKDKKYPTGTRTNRATAAGFWKATGRDKAIYSKQTELIGMRKTLVFYKGRAPNGQKSDWIMHEYRLETDENGTSQEEGWAVCRVFKKRIATTRKLNEYDDSPIWYEDQVAFMDSPKQCNLQYNYSCKKEMDNLQYGLIPPDHHFLQLPNLESPKMPQAQTIMGSNPLPSYGQGLNVNVGLSNFQSSGLSQEHILQQPLDDHLTFRNIHEHGQHSSGDQVTDWRVLDKFVAYQLSHEDIISKENEESNLISKHETALENASTSSSSCHIGLWK